MNNRAITVEEKLLVIEKLKNKWLQHPQLRFGQLISNLLVNTDSDLFYIEDKVLSELEIITHKHNTTGTSATNGFTTKQVEI